MQRTCVESLCTSLRTPNSFMLLIRYSEPSEPTDIPCAVQSRNSGRGFSQLLVKRAISISVQYAVSSLSYLLDLQWLYVASDS